MKIENSHKSYGGETIFYAHDSEKTQSLMRFAVFVPEKKPCRAIIWLSGLTCTAENFIAKSGIQAILATGDVMVICPDTSPRDIGIKGEDDSYDFGSGAGFYVNATTEGYEKNYHMYDYVNDEIYGILQTDFSIASDKISIMGHSMGGHGALVIGLRNPDKYQSVSAFAPIVNPTACPWGQKAFAGYLGDDKDAWNVYDACHLITQGNIHSKEILIDQGTGDEFLIEQLLSDNLVKGAEGTGQDIALNMREGYDHSFYFIATFLQEHIDFHKKHLGSSE